MSRPNNRISGGLYLYWPDTSMGNKPKLKWEGDNTLFVRTRDESGNFSIEQATDSSKGGPTRNRWMQLMHMPTKTILHMISIGQEPQVTKRDFGEGLEHGYNNRKATGSEASNDLLKGVEIGKKLRLAENKLKMLAQYLVDNTPFEDDLSDTLSDWLRDNQ